MNNNVMCLVVGAVAGSAITYIVCSDIFNKKFDDEYAALKEYYDKKLYNMKEATKDDEEYVESEKSHVEEIQENKSKVKRVKVDDVEIEPDYEDIIEKLNYNKYSTKTSSELSKEPVVITLEEYGENNNFDKKIYSYFADDDVIMDSETEEVIDDANRILGYDNLEYLANTEESNEIYVRNELYGCDYQIILESGSYEDYLTDDFS